MQADLLKEADAAGGVAPAEIEELRCLSDLALCMTKQVALAIGCFLVALIVTKRHLRLNLSGLIEKDRSFVLDAPVLPAGLFGSAAEMVVHKFREARKVKSVASEGYIPCLSQLPFTHLEPEPAAGPS